MKGQGKVWLRVTLALGLALMLVLSLAMDVGATRVTENSIAAGEVIDDDVIIGGENVRVDGTVLGDLVAAGNSVTLNGTVQGSVIAMGADVHINGTVQGSVYAAASSVTLGPGANVGRNAYMAGYSVQTASDTQVKRDLLAAGYQALLSGAVGQDVRAAAGAIELRGSVGRDVLAEVGAPGKGGKPYMFMPNNSGYQAPPAVDPGLRVYPEASIGGDLRYKSTEPQEGAIQARPEGRVTFTLQEPTAAQPAQPTGWKGMMWSVLRWLGRLVRDLVTLLIVGGLAIWKLPTILEDVTEHLRAKPWPCLGWGFIGWVVGYVAVGVLFAVIVAIGVILAAVTLGGLASTWFGLGLGTLGVAFTAFLFLVSIGSKVVAANWLGRAIFGARRDVAAFWPLAVGVLIYVVVHSIPVLGWLVGLAATAFGLGAMLLEARERGWLGKAG